MFCLAACLNIIGAVYYSNFQLKKATRGFGRSPEIYKALAIIEITVRSLRQQHNLIEPTLDGRLLDAETVRQVKSLNDAVGQVSTFLSESEYLFANSSDIRQFEARLASHAAVVHEYLDPSSHERQVDDIDILRKKYLAEYENLKAQLLSLQGELRESQDRDAGLVQSAVVMYFVLFGVVLAEIVALMVTFSFFRNWMLRPIEAIRLATEQIASGNLEYRLQESKEDELGALAREVNHMAGSLAVAQKQLKQKERAAATGEMVSVVAHNIRNPVAGIRATAQTCMRDFESGSPTYDQQQRIIKAVDSLEQWLKELVHLNRSIELNIEPTNVDELVDDLRQIFDPHSQRKNVTIKYRPARPRQLIAVDRQHFIQAMASILDNAIEAAPPGSAVDIRTGQSTREGDEFFIEISDLGHGVPDALRSQVFEPYFSTKQGGTGIGLSMAKKIVQAHSGKLSVAAGNGKSPRRVGATFRIEIPLYCEGRTGASAHG